MAAEQAEVTARRMRWAARRWRPIAACLLGAPLVVIAIVSSLYWPGRVFPGFFLLTNRLVPTIGLYSWTGLAAGIPFHARVVAADDQPVQGPADAYDHAAQRSEGERVRYTV